MILLHFRYRRISERRGGRDLIGIGVLLERTGHGLLMFLASFMVRGVRLQRLAALKVQ